MIRNKLNIKGETLAETIIALSILSIGITISSMVILNSMRNLIVAKQRVIAVNIAREGIEAVRSIRDTNWLLYSDRRRQCWNHDPNVVAACDGSNPITPDTYIVYKHDPEGSWRLQLADANLLADSPLNPDGNTTNELDLVELSFVDVDTGTNSDSLDADRDGDEDDDDSDMYNHMHSGVTDPFGELVAYAPFSRYIVIEYIENQPTLPSDSIDTPAEWIALDPITERPLLNRMRVTSVVEWTRKGITHSVELKTIITDHLGREDLAS